MHCIGGLLSWESGGEFLKKHSAGGRAGCGSTPTYPPSLQGGGQGEGVFGDQAIWISRDVSKLHWGFVQNGEFCAGSLDRMLVLFVHKKFTIKIAEK